MKADVYERFYDERANLSALFINFDMEVLLDAEPPKVILETYYAGIIGNRLYIPDSVFTRGAMILRQQGFGGVTEYANWLGMTDNHLARVARYSAWMQLQAHQRNIARRRTEERFATEERRLRPFYNATTAQRYKNEHYNARMPLPPLFKDVAKLIRDTITAERGENYTGVRGCKTELLSRAYAKDYPTPMSEIVRAAMWKRWPTLTTALDLAKLRLQTGHWTRPIWAEYPWANRNPLHFAHASRETPGNIAFYPDVTKMEADKLTSMKPGRYLMTFYGDLFSADEIKELSNKQQHASAPVQLKFVANTDPDGWVWVYENSAPSCMRYNRSKRYLASALGGEYHPVRAYAHPENQLALAYIMRPGKVEDRSFFCAQDEYIVAARTIVNTCDMTYLRIYAEDDRFRTALRDALRDAGYSESSHTLEDQRLTRMYYGSDTICPYLDGNYTNVELVSDNYMVVSDYGYDGQQSSGLLSGNENRCYCGWCDSYFDEDEGSYIESVSEWVCDDCNGEHFVDAIGYRGRSYRYPENSSSIVYCEYNSEYYVVEYLGDNDMGEDDSGEIFPNDMLVSTSRGLVCNDNATELTYAYEGDDWAHDDDVYRLPDGETCHVDDADKIAELDPQQQEAA